MSPVQTSSLRSQRFRASAAHLAPARRTVIAQARESGMAADDVERLSLAVSEAMTNCVLHAYSGGEKGMVEVTSGVRGDTFVVTVTDDGDGMCKRPGSTGLGVGMSLIARMSVAVRVLPGPGGRGTRVQMSFPLAG